MRLTNHPAAEAKPKKKVDQDLATMSTEITLQLATLTTLVGELVEKRPPTTNRPLVRSWKLQIYRCVRKLDNWSDWRLK